MWGPGRDGKDGRSRSQGTRIFKTWSEVQGRSLRIKNHEHQPYARLGTSHQKGGYFLKGPHDVSYSTKFVNSHDVPPGACDNSLSILIVKRT